MLRLIPPGPLPEWIPLDVQFSHKSDLQRVEVASWLLAWKRDGVLWLRPVLGGYAFLIESAGASAKIGFPGIAIDSRPDKRVRLLVAGQQVT